MSDHADQTGEAPPKFRRRKEARPDELLDAALDLFTEQGFDRTTVEQIARRAGVSKGALYLYFPSKDAVIESLVDRAVGHLVGEVVAQIEAFKGDPRVLLQRFVPLFTARLSDPRVIAVPKLVVREAVNHPQLAQMYRERVIGRVVPALTALFRQGVAGGHIRAVDPEMAVRSLLGPVFLHVLLADVFDVRPEGATAEDIGIARLLDTHLSIFFAGLAPAPEQEAPHG
jgi:AcrR family transcriptional regulator